MGKRGVIGRPGELTMHGITKIVTQSVCCFLYPRGHARAEEL